MKMQYLSCVEVVVEKEVYAKQGVHKGMQGVIWLAECMDGEWDVYFPQRGDQPDIAEISVKEEDLKCISKMDATINERIRAEWENRLKS